MIGQISPSAPVHIFRPPENRSQSFRVSHDFLDIAVCWATYGSTLSLGYSKIRNVGVAGKPLFCILTKTLKFALFLRSPGRFHIVLELLYALFQYK